jgi:hypothetical protein
MFPINFVFMSCKMKKQESPEYYTGCTKKVDNFETALNFTNPSIS